MSTIKCELFCGSDNSQMQIIYTGFRWLEKQGKIELSYHNCKKTVHSEVLVKVNDSIYLFFETKDSGFGATDKERLRQSDYLFKRCFSAKDIGPEIAYKKAFPLGLTYVVYEKYPSRFSLQRAFLRDSFGKKAIGIFRALLGPANSLHPRLFRLHVDNCCAEPDPSLPAGVIYMARLWAPSANTLADPVFRAQREALNLMRVECIRKLKKEFGSRFMGGLAHNAFSARYFPDCLFQDAGISAFGNCMRLLRQYPIGVATAGLRKSTGYKFAEYMAFSKAIVSEKLYYEVPGLEKGKHYLEFTTADECVEGVSTLMEDKDLRTKMMYANHDFYQAQLRPDMLVWNALNLALEQSNNQ
jgi:hypothetical protein